MWVPSWGKVSDRMLTCRDDPQFSYGSTNSIACDAIMEAIPIADAAAAASISIPPIVTSPLSSSVTSHAASGTNSIQPSSAAPSAVPSAIPSQPQATNTVGASPGSSSSKFSLSLGTIIGIIIGSVLLLGVLIVASILYYRQYHRPRSQKQYYSLSVAELHRT